MMRHLAYATPINPVASGISDYSEELLPYLGRYADITLYIDDRLRPTNPQLARHLTIRPLSKLARDHRPSSAALTPAWARFGWGNIACLIHGQAHYTRTAAIEI